MERKKHQTIAIAKCEACVTIWYASLRLNHANAVTTLVHLSIFGMRLKMKTNIMRFEFSTAVKIHTVIFWV
jgi:hypothetical protein